MPSDLVLSAEVPMLPFNQGYGTGREIILTEFLTRSTSL